MNEHRGTHGLGWQDEQMADVTSCGDKLLRERSFVINTDTVTACPECGARLKLVWHVYALELP